MNARCTQGGLLLLLLPCLTAAEQPLSYVLSTADGKPVRGKLDRLSEGWELRLGGERTYKASEWTNLRRADQSLPLHPAGPHLILTNGDRIRIDGSSLAFNGERFSFTCPWLGEGKTVRISLAAVALVWRAAPDSAEDGFVFRRRLLETKRRRDVVVLRNGDLLEGDLTSLGPVHAELEVNRKTVKLAADQAAVLAPSTFLASAVKPKATHVSAVLADGSRISLLTATCDGRALTGTAVPGIPLRVPLDQLIALDLLGGPAVYLSDLTPARYDHTPYLSVTWPLAVNSSCAGRELRLKDGMHDRGLGMHSEAKATYTVPAGMRFFEVRVGLDEVSGRRGSVRVRVLADGKERDPGRTRDLKHGEMLDVRLDVKGVKELTLAVDFGEGGDVGDHVNWVDARFVR